jgi:UDP-N-acetylglucosamine acyltransferase
MTAIDATARIADGAVLGPDVVIGPFCSVGPDVVLGAGCKLIASVHIGGRTTIGARTVVHPYAVLGGPPQSISYRGEPTQLVIGSDCMIREHVTMNTGTAGTGGVTRVGDRGYFMMGSHVAHDCQVGNDAIFANASILAGHCVLGDHVFISGLVAVHQFSRIGSGALVAGGAIIRSDVIPFGLAAGPQARLTGLNVVGMRRRNHTPQSINAARRAFRKLFLTPGTLAERIDAVEAELGHEDAVAQIVAFMRAPTRRPLCQPRLAASRGTHEDTLND